MSPNKSLEPTLDCAFPYAAAPVGRRQVRFSEALGGKMDFDLAGDFQAISQIAITLTGFTGIIGAIQTRSGKSLAGPEAYLIATLLIVSGFTIFACFIPGTIGLLGVEPGDVWKYSFQVLIVAHVGAWLIALPFMARAGFLLQKLPEPVRTITRIFTGLGITAVLAEAVIVSGKFTEYSAFVFQCVLIAMISIAFVVFVLMLFGFNRESVD